MEQQNQNVQVEEGISLMDIVKLLLSKIKLLILVVLISGIAGGLFAVWRTIDVNYFGTKVEFYVNPEKPEESKGTTSGTAAGGSQYGVYGAYGRHVMDNMVKLLSSDSFAEQLILNGYALPGKTTVWTGEQATPWFAQEATITINGESVLRNTYLNALLDAAKPFVDAVNSSQAVYNEALSAKAAAVSAYSVAETNLENEWRIFSQDFEGVKGSFSREEYLALDPALIPAPLKQAYDNFVEAQKTVIYKTADVTDAEQAWKTAQKEAKAPVNAALELWRTSPLYIEQLNFYKGAVSYSYLAADEDYEDANNLARSFIYVTISVQNSNATVGMEKGNDILRRVKNVVPAYIEENMTVPDGYNGTNCQRITRTDSIRLTNPRYTTTEAIKYAFLLAAAGFVIASVIIIILDRSDKRLRDTEIITRKFNIPLLGIVPTIEELNEENAAKKNATKTTEVK